VIDGRTYTVLCECKHWAARVPQNVIHGFRTVVADSGANLGYIISMEGFQSGAFTSAELTNIRLVTWQGFQSEFEASWIKHHLVPTITERLDPLFSYTEPLLPGRFRRLDEPSQRQFLEIRKRHELFGTVLMMLFSSHARMITQRAFPTLPLRAELAKGVAGAERFIPDTVLDATGYSDFLDAALTHGEDATREFMNVLRPDPE
jgi:restriction system protein